MVTELHAKLDRQQRSKVLMMIEKARKCEISRSIWKGSRLVMFEANETWFHLAKDIDPKDHALEEYEEREDIPGLVTGVRIPGYKYH